MSLNGLVLPEGFSGNSSTCSTQTKVLYLTIKEAESSCSRYNKGNNHLEMLIYRFRTLFMTKAKKKKKGGGGGVGGVLRDQKSMLKILLCTAGFPSTISGKGLLHVQVGWSEISS